LGKAQLKILLLSRNETDFYTGGIAEVIYQLSQELPKIGVQVIVYAGSEVTRSQPIDALKNGTLCYTGPILKPGLLSLLTEKNKLSLITDIIHQHDIQLIQTCGIYRAGYMALRLKLRLGIPYVLTSHGDISSQFSKRNKKTKNISRYQAIFKSAAAVTYLTASMAEIAHQIYNTRDKCKIIPNGINLSEWKCDMQSVVTPYLFCIGRIVKEKGFAVIIETYAKLIDAGLKLSLVIAGEGPEKNNLIEKAKLLNLNVVEQLSFDSLSFPAKTVCFVGNVKGHIKTKLFMHSKLVLFPTQPTLVQESFGLVPFEAFAAKRPLIMSQLDRVDSLKEEGFQFQVIEKSNDSNAWYKTILENLNQSESPRMLDDNFAKLKSYDWRLVVKQYRDVWRSCIIVKPYV
jgi:glycosyltransferase involved in cell wall biosynthesis